MALNDRHVRELFERSLEGRLEEAERKAFEAHLAECGMCAAEYETALAVRGQLRALPAAALSEREAAGIVSRLERTMEERVPVSRIMTYSLAAAAAVLLLTLPGRFDPGKFLARSALGLDGSGKVAGGPDEARARLAGKVMGKLDPRPLVSFGSPADWGKISITGFAQPGFRIDGRLGRRVLRIGRAGKGADIRQLIVPAGDECEASAVSALLFCEDGAATVSLDAVTDSGRVIDVTSPRRAAAMEWQWVVFRLRRGEVPEDDALHEFRFNVRGDTAVRFDSLEAWCNMAAR